MMNLDTYGERKNTPFILDMSYFPFSMFKKNVAFSNSLIPTSHMAYLRAQDSKDILVHYIHL